MSLRDQMDRIYTDVSLEDIPWNMSEPPRLLIDAVDSNMIEPCRVIDLGCGAGNYAVWLALKGFDVTAVDLSRQAIRHAEALAARHDVTCRFVVADLLGDRSELPEGFDLAIDWEVLHHIFPQDRSVFVRNVRFMLNPGGKYLSVCFSEADPAFGGTGKRRRTPLGTTLYFSNEQELRALFEPEFRILELRTQEIGGKYGSHLANVAWLQVKN